MKFADNKTIEYRGRYHTRSYKIIQNIIQEELDNFEDWNTIHGIKFDIKNVEDNALRNNRKNPEIKTKNLRIML